MRLAHFLHCSNGKTRGRPYGKPLTIIVPFIRLNQQFNDNCCRDRYESKLFPQILAKAVEVYH